MASHKMSRYPGLPGMIWLLLLIMQVMDTHALWEWFRAGTRPTTATSGKESAWKEKVEEEVLGTTSRTRTKQGSSFDIESVMILGGSARGKQLYEKSTALTVSGNACWQLAYSGLAQGCREILKDENQKSRLALRLTDCFLKTSGRAGLDTCADSFHISSCVKDLDDHIHSIFLAFYIDASAMCHYLQSQEFKMETENIVNELKTSARNAENTLNSMSEIMEERQEIIVNRAEHILDVQKNMQREQAIMQANLEEGMEGIHEAAAQAEEQLQLVNKYQKAIQDAQQDLAESLASELYDLQMKSNQLGRSMTHLHGSVEELTDKSEAGQEEAMKTLTELQNMQLDAMKESKRSMNRLAQDAQRHQEDFQNWQNELDRMHQRLVAGSANMIKAQEMFVERQAEVFTSIEKLFSLHNTMLHESRGVKTVMLYFAVSMFVFMATTPKRTRTARLFLFFGLFLTLTFEIWLIRFRKDKIDLSALKLQEWPSQKIVWLRYTSGAGAVAYLIFTLLTFKDYEVLNYQMLKDIHGSFGDYLARSKVCKDISQPAARAAAYRQYESQMERRVAGASRRTRSSPMPKCCCPEAKSSSSTKARSSRSSRRTGDASCC